MKVGDLVKYVGDNCMDPPTYNHGCNYNHGLVTGFDVDGDPIVLFHGDPDPEGLDGSAFLMQNIEVISESR